MVAKGGLGNETYLPVGAERAGDWCCLLALLQVCCLWADWVLRRPSRINRPTGPGLPCWLRRRERAAWGDAAHLPVRVGAALCDARTAKVASIALAITTKGAST